MGRSLKLQPDLNKANAQMQTNSTSSQLLDEKISTITFRCTDNILLSKNIFSVILQSQDENCELLELNFCHNLSKWWNDIFGHKLFQSLHLDLKKISKWQNWIWPLNTCYKSWKSLLICSTDAGNNVIGQRLYCT